MKTRQGEVRYCDKSLKRAGGLLSAFLLEAMLGQAASEPCSRAVVNSASLCSQVTAGMTGFCRFAQVSGRAGSGARGRGLSQRFSAASRAVPGREWVASTLPGGPFWPEWCSRGSAGEARLCSPKLAPGQALVAQPFRPWGPLQLPGCPLTLSWLAQEPC